MYRVIFNTLKNNGYFSILKVFYHRQNETISFLHGLNKKTTPNYAAETIRPFVQGHRKRDNLFGSKTPLGSHHFQ